MKKITLLITIVLLVIALVSCSKEPLESGKTVCWTCEFFTVDGVTLPDKTVCTDKGQPVITNAYCHQ